jgi:quinol---cytochrome c reductase iron-sulfur subunit, bacillus type
MTPRRSASSSNYTQDRHIPGAFEGETVTRRRLMTGVATTAGAVAAAAFTLPALGFAIAPALEHTADTWQQVGPVARFTTTNYLPEVITIEPGVGEAGLSILDSRDPLMCGMRALGVGGVL